MFRHIQKDSFLRFFYLKNEFFKISILFLIYNRVLNNNFNFRNKIIFLAFFHDRLRKMSLNKIHNFCIITGRGRGVYRFFHFSRLILREYASRGKINGLYKISW